MNKRTLIFLSSVFVILIIVLVWIVNAVMDEGNRIFHEEYDDRSYICDVSVVSSNNPDEKSVTHLEITMSRNDKKQYEMSNSKTVVTNSGEIITTSTKCKEAE